VTLFDVPASRPVEMKIRSTPNLRKELSSIWMCSWCGLLLVHAGTKPPEGNCPNRHDDQGWWWQQHAPAGPFFYDHDLVHALADLVGLDAAQAFEVLIAHRDGGTS
jgi:hypothetical protein